MTKKEFARTYLDSLRVNYPNVKFALNNELVITSKYGDLDYKHHIDDDFLAYKAEPDSIDKVIGRYVALTRDLYADSKTIFINRIVPVIKSVEYLEEINSTDKGGKVSPVVTDKYNSQLVIAYAKDSKNGISYLTEDDFKKLSISRDTLKSTAIRNSRKIMSSIKRHGDNGLFILMAGGKYEASLILSSQIWTKEFLPVDGEFIIAIPKDGMLIITGSNNRSGLVKLKEMVMDSYKSGNHKISDHLYKLTGNKFEIYH